MTPRSLIAVTAVLLCITLGLVSPAASSRGLRCCTTFAKKPIPFKVIRGYRLISDAENCRNKATVFITKMKKEICARPGEKWVGEALKYLSELQKEMSKPAADATKSEGTSVNDGSGSFSSTTETIPSTTDGYYW